MAGPAALPSAAVVSSTGADHVAPKSLEVATAIPVEDPRAEVKATCRALWSGSKSRAVSTAAATGQGNEATGKARLQVVPRSWLTLNLIDPPSPSRSA